MKRKTRQFRGIFLILITLLLISIFPSGIFANQQVLKDLSCKSAVLMDDETGQILFEKDAHKKVIPASIVKMMVLLLVMEKLDAAAVHLSDVVTVSAWASKIGGHQVYLAEGEKFTLQELLKAVAISSANDAATAVAEFLAGNADACVKMMNDRAKTLGMNDTTFANVHGLPPDKGQKENSTSAYDVALLGRELLKYPQVLSWTSTIEDTFRNGTFTLTNTNRQLIRTYQGVDGLKTGFHPRGADFSLCVTAKRQNRRVIAVVMGSPTKVERFHAARSLLDLGFNQFTRVLVLRKGFVVGESIRIAGGKDRTTTAVAAENAVVLIQKGQEQQIVQEIHIPGQGLRAPISRGTKVGEAIISVEDKPVTTVDLVVEKDIKQGSVVDRLKWWILDKVS